MVDVAQWWSTRLWIWWLRVQVPSSTHKRKTRSFRVGLLYVGEDLNWEGGRGNGSFPVVEILKPQGVRKFCGCKILFNYPSSTHIE